MKNFSIRTKKFSRLVGSALLLTMLSVSHFIQAEPRRFTDNNTLHSTKLDKLTDNALQAIVGGDWKNAALNAQQLTEKFPDYALGHLLLAEARTVLGTSTPLLQSDENFSAKLVDLLLEARARAHQHNTTNNGSFPDNPFVPEEIIQIGTHIDHVVLVDLASSSLSLFDTTLSQPRLLKQHYISSGEGGFGKLAEGDLKSPLGVYRVYGFRGDESLPSLYGSGALMLNYPNVLDRSLGRSGSGIWLHGNPRTNRSRSPRSSEGCVTMANDHLTDLYNQIDIRRTHVILSHNVNWRPWDESELQRERSQELFEQYRSAWLNNRLQDLTSIYSTDGLPSHVRYAGQVQAKKVSAEHAGTSRLSPIGINLESLANLRNNDISILINPDIKHNAGTHLIMAFELPNQGGAQVTLYWERNANGYWQIKREEIEAKGV